MAIQKAVRVQVWAISDGESDAFTFDLMSDPYWIGSATTSGIGGRIMNWFAEADEVGASLPVGVLTVDGAVSATLVGTVVTVNVPVQPAEHKYVVTLDFLFGDTSAPPITTDLPVNVDLPYASGPNSPVMLGDVLTCTMGNWDNMYDEPHSYAYQWMRLDINTSSTDVIDGATDLTYQVVDADNPSFVSCIVAATNAAGSAHTVSNSIEISFGGASGQAERTKKRR